MVLLLLFEPKRGNRIDPNRGGGRDLTGQDREQRYRADVGRGGGGKRCGRVP